MFESHVWLPEGIQCYSLKGNCAPWLKFATRTYWKVKHCHQGIRARQLRSTQAKQRKIRKKHTVDVNAFVIGHFTSLWTSGLWSLFLLGHQSLPSLEFSSTNSGPKNSAANAVPEYPKIFVWTFCRQPCLHSSAALKWSTTATARAQGQQALAGKNWWISPKSH